MRLTGDRPKAGGLYRLLRGSLLGCRSRDRRQGVETGFRGSAYGGLRTPVPTEASPAFIAAAEDDEFQPVDATLLFAAGRGAEVPAELYVNERGGHRFDLAVKAQPATIGSRNLSGG